MLATDSGRRPHAAEITEFQTKGESGKELIYSNFIYPGFHISNYFVYSLLSSTIQPELGSVLSPQVGAEAVN